VRLFVCKADRTLPLTVPTLHSRTARAGRRGHSAAGPVPAGWRGRARRLGRACGTTRASAGWGLSRPSGRLRRTAAPRGATRAPLPRQRARRWTAPRGADEACLGPAHQARPVRRSGACFSLRVPAAPTAAATFSRSTSRAAPRCAAARPRGCPATARCAPPYAPRPRSARAGACAALTPFALLTDARGRLDPAPVRRALQQRRRALLRRRSGCSAPQGLKGRHRVRFDRGVCRPRQRRGARGLAHDGRVLQPEARGPDGRGGLQCHGVGIIPEFPCRIHGTPSSLWALVAPSTLLCGSPPDRAERSFELIDDFCLVGAGAAESAAAWYQTVALGLVVFAAIPSAPPGAGPARQGPVDRARASAPFPTCAARRKYHSAVQRRGGVFRRSSIVSKSGYARHHSCLSRGRDHSAGLSRPELRDVTSPCPFVWPTYPTA